MNTNTQTAVASPVMPLVLSDSELRAKAPAVFAKAGAKHMSKRYVPLPTIDIINVLKHEGYSVTAAKQERARRRDKAFHHHMAILTHTRYLNKTLKSLGEGMPRIIITNSANGLKQLSIKLGFYRLVCLNGLVVATGEFGAMFQKHIGVEMKEVVELVKKLSKQGEKIMQHIDAWQKIKLTDRQQLVFARKVAVLRFGEEGAKQYEPQELLAVRRDADKGNSLWRVFNRVQENAMKGGFEGHNALNRAVRARSLTGINRDIGFNEQLWQMAEKLAA